VVSRCQAIIPESRDVSGRALRDDSGFRPSYGLWPMRTKIDDGFVGRDYEVGQA
jgi:hypothetical protein